MPKYIFEARNITKKYYGSLALDAFQMQIPEGSIYGFIGENGAGKTTLIRLAAGLDFPTEGTVSLFGDDTPKGLMRQRRRTGFLVEGPALYLDMNAKQNLEMVRMQRGIPEKSSTDGMLELFSLQHTGRKRVKDFSLGMRQRLGIAMALIGEPEFLVLDEPINGLDPTGILEIRNLLKRLNYERGTTILVSSHILSELDHMATHYGFIHKGKMVQEITAKSLAEKCRRYILLRVPNPEKAAALLELKFKDIPFEVYPDRSIHVYSVTERTAELSSYLAENHIFIEEMTIRGDNLETYFENLVGGE